MTKSWYIDQQTRKIWNSGKAEGISSILQRGCMVLSTFCLWTCSLKLLAWLYIFSGNVFREDQQGLRILLQQHWETPKSWKILAQPPNISQQDLRACPLWAFHHLLSDNVHISHFHCPHPSYANPDFPTHLSRYDKWDSLAYFHQSMRKCYHEK
jgi:hypothetical protein